MLNSLLDLIYPPSCLACETKLDKEGLCRDCATNIRHASPAINEISSSVTTGTKRHYVYHQRVYSLGLYEGALKKLISLFKYKAKPELTGVLSRLLIDFAQNHLDMKRFGLVIPVPLHTTRLREREFNQASLLAKPLAAKFGIAFSEETLIRKRPTPSQSNLKKDQRQENLKSAFEAVKPALLLEKHVLLCDDVFTTGATARECTKALLSCGAKEVTVLTLARGE